jgi:hypothetical protein
LVREPALYERAFVLRELFPDAEAGEDQVQDVVAGGGAGDFVERAEGAVKIEQKHFVGDAVVDGGLGGFEGSKRVTYKRLVAGVGEESGFGGGGGVSGDVAENGGAEFGDAGAGEGGGGNCVRTGWRSAQIGFVFDDDCGAIFNLIQQGIIFGGLGL